MLVDILEGRGEEGGVSMRERGDAGQRRVDAIKEAALRFLDRNARAVAMIADGERAAEWDVAASVLRFLLAPAFAGHLDIGTAQDRVEGAFGDFNVRRGDGIAPLFCDVIVEAYRRPLLGGIVVNALAGGREERNAGVNLKRRPGTQALRDLIGKDSGVSGEFEDLLSGFSRDLVMTVPVGDVSGEDGGDDHRTVQSHGADNIVEDAVAPPFLVGFFDGL